MTRSDDRVDVLRYAAFPDDGRGGNPAGLVLDATGLDDDRRQALAAEVGYSETAFLEPGGPGRYRLRFFSPTAEVAFCGHATIAAAVLLAERDGPGPITFDTPAGDVAVRTARSDQGVTATMTSVPTSTRPLTEDELAALLSAVGLDREDLDDRFPAHVAFAGNHHPVLVLRTRERLSDVTAGSARLAELMAGQGWTTVHLVHARSEVLVEARNLFPDAPGGEDPATGSAALAFGGYLRDMGLVQPPARVTVLQGHDMGVPCRLEVDVPAGDDRVHVTGTALPIDPPTAR
jgi:PhzF family phenazine biosynthesis protein